MFDMGFEPQIGMFLQSTRPDKQVAMFSATLPAHVEALARKAGWQGLAGAGNALPPGAEEANRDLCLEAQS